MPNSKFTDRLNGALDLTAKKLQLGEFRPDSRSLFSPVYRAGRFCWAKVMESDGVLLSRRKVLNEQGGHLESETEIVMGVIFQSEDATSQTKPNPIGKAAIGHIENGVWVTVEKKRLRVDQLSVAFILPKGASAKHQKAFDTARRNVLNASAMMPNAMVIEVNRGIGKEKLADVLTKELRAVLCGPGRPRHSA